MAQDTQESQDGSGEIDVSQCVDENADYGTAEGRNAAAKDAGACAGAAICAAYGAAAAAPLCAYVGGEIAAYVEGVLEDIFGDVDVWKEWRTKVASTQKSADIINATVFQARSDWTKARRVVSGMFDPDAVSMADEAKIANRILYECGADLDECSECGELFDLPISLQDLNTLDPNDSTAIRAHAVAMSESWYPAWKRGLDKATTCAVAKVAANDPEFQALVANRGEVPSANPVLINRAIRLDTLPNEASQDSGSDTAILIGAALLGGLVIVKGF